MNSVDAQALRRVAVVLRGDALRAEWWSGEVSAGRPSLSSLTGWTGVASGVFHAAIDEMTMQAVALDGALSDLAPSLVVQADLLEAEAARVEHEAAP